MTDEWVARFEEGYVTDAGEHVTLTDQLYRDQPWESPGAALRYWRSNGLAAGGTEVYLNGLQQATDVSLHADFAALNVKLIWRRVSFGRTPSSASSVDNTHQLS